MHQHKQICSHPSTQKCTASTQSLFGKQAALGKKGWEFFSTMFGNVWHAETPCWLPTAWEAENRTADSADSILICYFCCCFECFSSSLVKVRERQEGLLPLKPTAGFPSMAKCQNVCLTKQFCISTADY